MTAARHSEESGGAARAHGGVGVGGRGACVWCGGCSCWLSPFLLGAAALLAVFYHFGHDPNLPSLRGIGDYHPPQITRVLDREGNLIGEIARSTGPWCPTLSFPRC